LTFLTDELVIETAVEAGEETGRGLGVGTLGVATEADGA
jgi:hypothetical protein